MICDLLGRSIFQVRDKIISLLFLLEAGEDHLCTWDVLFRVFEVYLQGILIPDNSFCKNSQIEKVMIKEITVLEVSFTFVQVGFGVGETCRLTSLTTEKSIQIRSGLVLAACFNRVALRAASDKDFLTVFDAHFSLKFFQIINF